MDVKVFYKQVSIVCALLAIVSFCTLTFAAIRAYPGEFSPFSNYLSDLGNSVLNPPGALFFNAGCILAGISTFLFFLGLVSWRIKGQEKLTMARLLGMFSGVALFFVGIFSENYGKLHSITALIFFVSLVVAILATDYALRKHPSFARLIEYYGYLVAFFSVVYIGSYLLGRPIIIAEWITVVGALGWTGLMAYNMARLSPARLPAAKKA